MKNFNYNGRSRSRRPNNRNIGTSRPSAFSTLPSENAKFSGTNFNSQRGTTRPRSSRQPSFNSRPMMGNIEEILSMVRSDNDSLGQLLSNGDLLAILRSSNILNRMQIHHLLSAFNTYKNNENSPQSIRSLFTTILASPFIPEMSSSIVPQYFQGKASASDMEIMLHFLLNCLELLPHIFREKMASLYPCVIVACEQFQEPIIKELFSRLKESFEVAKNLPIERPLCLALSSITLSDDKDFRGLSVIPNDSDIFCLNEEVKLRPNKFGTEDIKYESVDDYLATQFCLLKEDFVRPLRDGIAAIREDMLTKPKIRTKQLQIRVYEKVIVEDMYTCKNGLVYRVVFDVSKFRKIDWKKARRFIYGSLLCFTNDFFNTVYFASVVDGDAKNLEKGILVVQFDLDPILQVLENNEFMMIETKNLFEAYRHVLTKLQTFTQETLPFQENIVFGENMCRPPAYMDKRDLKLIDSEGARDKDLDDSQNRAFINALKSSLSLIQGPPGTGKTYVGLKIIKYLVNNFQNNRRNLGPILVVCYTNHALDQFLSDIIQAIGIEKVIRVGGRSKLEIMKDCNISSIKWKWVRKKAFKSDLFRRGVQNRKAIEVAEEMLIRKYVKIKNYDKKILTFDEIDCCFEGSHVRYFQRNSFDAWIKGGGSILSANDESISSVKQKMIQELCSSLINDYTYEVVSEICKEVNTEMTSEECDDEDVKVEDPEDVLNDQRFLDEDAYLLKNVKRFQRLYEDFNENDSEAKEDEDGFKYVANIKLIKNKLKVTKPLSEEEYKATTNLDLDFDVRLRLYKYWLEKYRIVLFEEYKAAKSCFDDLNKEREAIYFEEYIEIMLSMNVIGMTTTGASRYGSVLDQVGCRVVIIEEAAEVIESHVVCSLSRHCEQLIMIGDHKQLRPKVEVYELEIDYNLGISLFERLVVNNCQYFTLQYQHRMRPDISKCVKPIYPDLQDSENVFEYESISGMKKDIYFLNHTAQENESIETSYKNDFEAEFVSKFCEYLVRNGNLPGQITILTLYSGQLYNISARMRKPIFKGTRICVVDNFQGEENDIIVLSLVRSNVKGVVGFVKSANRLCVALSRAKRGFYVIGNFNMLCNKIELLRDIIETSLDETTIGSKLPLKCLMHPEEDNYFIASIDDFSRQGCPAKCHMQLGCGHLCQRVCHREAPSHKGYKCGMPCEKQCRRNLHKCNLKCSQVCRCEEKISIKLPCGHVKGIVCEERVINCMEICGKTLDCDHRCVRMCHERCLCEVLIECVGDCGHLLEAVCGTDFATVKCRHDCEKILQCGHPCMNRCWEACTCEQVMEYTLTCSHTVRLRCGTDLDKVECHKRVERELDCGHIIKYECFRKGSKCSRKLLRKLRCGHMNHAKCSMNIEDILCKYVCQMKLNCGHSCQGGCGDCPQDRWHRECKERCGRPKMCGHACESTCHIGVCPPCDKVCPRYCVHSKCTMKCGDICECTVCKLQCQNNIRCIECKGRERCFKVCAEACSRFCRRCLRNGKNDFATESVLMDPCNCSILKEDLQPEMKIEDTEVFLVCQMCHRYLRGPYKGLLLVYFKKEYSGLFVAFDEAELLKWEDMFDDLEKIDLFPWNREEVTLLFSTKKIYREDLHIFNTCYSKIEEIIATHANMVEVSIKGNIKNHYDRVKKSMSYLVKWLNPFNRSLNPQEMDLVNLEMLKLSLSSEILTCLGNATISDYALVHKQLFDILTKLETFISFEEIEAFFAKFEEIKQNLKQTKESTKEEEELVDRIINARDIYKEFKMERFSVDEKLKEIKNLIRKCHPDKNKSAKANEAVKILLSKKELLE